MNSDIHPQNDSRVFIYNRSEQIGPMLFRDVRLLWVRNHFASDALIWMDGMENWKPLSSIVEHHEKNQKNSASSSDSRPILIVDDDSLTREIVCALLSQEKKKVKTANSFDTACTLMETEGLDAFDCVITDYSMPGGSGIDLVKWIRKQDDALQVLLLTSRDEKEIIKMGLRAGVFDFQEKPIRKKAFLSSLKEAIVQTRRKRDERLAIKEVVRHKMRSSGQLTEELANQIFNSENHITEILSKLDAISQQSHKIQNPGNPIIPGAKQLQPDDQLRGRIGEVSVIDLLQLLVHSGKTGKLTVHDLKHNITGEAFLEEGALIHACALNHQGMDAVLEILNCEQGSFEFHYNSRTNTRNIEEDSMMVLLSALKKIDTKKSLSTA